jgi:hypothetical protein
VTFVHSVLGMDRGRGSRALFRLDPWFHDIPPALLSIPDSGIRNAQKSAHLPHSHHSSSPRAARSSEQCSSHSEAFDQICDSEGARVVRHSPGPSLNALHKVQTIPSTQPVITPSPLNPHPADPSFNALHKVQTIPSTQPVITPSTLDSPRFEPVPSFSPDVNESLSVVPGLNEMLLLRFVAISGHSRIYIKLLPNRESGLINCLKKDQHRYNHV